MFLLLALLLLLFLPDPWNLVAPLVSLVLGAAEIVFWERRMRRHKVQTGIEKLVGATGVMTEPLAPVGQIRVLGELWKARSTEEVAVGDRVQVNAVDGLSLHVDSADNRPEGAAAGLGPVALLVAIMLALAGCGGDGSSASEEYANGVCSTLSTWITDVQETVQSVTDAGLATTREDIQAAFDDTTAATDTLVNDLQGLGTPDSEDGRAAKEQLDALATQLRQQLGLIEQALDSGEGLTSIAATVSTAVAAAANAVNTTYENLKGLDPAGELRDAFENSDDCNSLEEQLADLRS